MSRPSLPISTVRPGERVVIHLSHSWRVPAPVVAGEVVCVDGRAIRLTGVPRHPGDQVIPWIRVDRVSIDMQQEERLAGRRSVPAYVEGL
jgi:hypothetical protein